MELLKISPANVKTKKLAKLANEEKIYSLDLPAGYSCPFADKCLSKVVNGKIQDGPNCEVRCYSASLEVAFPSTHRARQHNFRLLKAAKSRKGMVELIVDSLPKDIAILRYHVGGDFFNTAYFLAAIDVAKAMPHIVFYTYTKNICDLIRFESEIPDNFKIVASYGGKYDHLIKYYGGVSARWVYSRYEARKKGLVIDNDDSHAITQKRNFCFIIHGTQQKGSKGSKTVSRERKIKKQKEL